jgi:RNA-splicing ligase RtcB
MHPLDPAPVSVVDEPYKKALDKYNREAEEALQAAHAKKLAAAPWWRRALRSMRRTCCSRCTRPSAEEIPPVYTPVDTLPSNLYVDLEGKLVENPTPVYQVATKDRTARRFL